MRSETEIIKEKDAAGRLIFSDPHNGLYFKGWHDALAWVMKEILND